MQLLGCHKQCTGLLAALSLVAPPAGLHCRRVPMCEVQIWMPCLQTPEGWALQALCFCLFGCMYMALSFYYRRLLLLQKSCSWPSMWCTWKRRSWRSLVSLWRSYWATSPGLSSSSSTSCVKADFQLFFGDNCFLGTSVGALKRIAPSWIRNLRTCSAATSALYFRSHSISDDCTFFWADLQYWRCFVHFIHGQERT